MPLRWAILPPPKRWRRPGGYFTASQALFYDVAIALLFLVQGLRPGHPRDFMTLAAIWLYGILALMLRDLVNFPLFSLLLLAILWLQVRRIRARASALEPGWGG